MRTYIRIKLFLVFVVLTLFNLGIRAQWIPTPGPVGGYVFDIIEFNNNLYAGLDHGGIFKLDNNEWNRIPGTDWYSVFSLSTIKNQWVVAGMNNGILLSSDVGQWPDFNSPEPFALCITANDSSIFIGTINGIFRTDDQGQSWTDLNSDITRTRIESIMVKDSLILAAGPQPGTLFRSPDNGKSWSAITDIDHSYYKFAAFAYDESYIYTAGGKSYRSSDLGLTWELISFDPNSGYYTDIKTLGDSLYLLGGSGNVYISSDKGDTWNTIEFNLDIPNNGFTSLAVSDNRLYVGNWGLGIFSRDLQNPTEWTEFNNGLTTVIVNKISVMNDTVFAGTENFLNYSSELNGEWHRILQPTMLIRALAVTTNELFVSDGTYDFGISNDRGNTWESGIISSDPGSENSLFIDDLTHNEDYFFAATSKGIFRSGDLGETWTMVIDTTIIDNEPVFTRIYSLDQYLIANSYQGAFLSQNNGDTWEKITTALSDQNIQASLMIDTIIFVSNNSGIYRSADFGTTWKFMSSLNNSVIFTLSNHEKSLLACSRNGAIWQSDDLGENWKSISDGLPDQGYISSIGFTHDYMLAGFYEVGQGIWKRPLYELFKPIARIFSSISDTSFIEGRSIDISFDQEIRNMEGGFITEDNIQDLIKITDAIDTSSSYSFTGEINNDNNTIRITPVGVMHGEKYIVSIAPVLNLASLASDSFISQPLLALANNPPVIENINKITEFEIAVDITAADFQNSYSDANNDPLKKIKIISLPHNGTITINDESISADQEFSLDSGMFFNYSPNPEYMGVDSILWNGSDGYDYSESPSKILISVAFTTGIISSVEDSPQFIIYPNPFNNLINLKLSSGIRTMIEMKIYNLHGQLIYSELKTAHSELNEIPFKVDDFPPGLYFCQVRTDTGELYIRKLIRK